jgi:hypothetical protein
MTANDDSATQGNEPKPKSARKPKGTPPGRPVGKRAVNLSLPIPIYERLAIHAIRQTNGNVSELVERLVLEGCRELHLTRTSSKAETGQEAQ